MDEPVTRTLMVHETPAPPGAAASPPVPTSDHEIIAGYALQERLGSGGYGEVWRAIGPGGLHKAVKILHGLSTGPQADTELKAMEKIKELRHPFLLNIERIEVAAGRMIIVTELAEKSLEDRFEEVRREGRPGIARDELLGYLRDAADALDFMAEQHGLQHLDIKPGNLLLQGGHAKVADFGLTKDVRHTQQSIVGGFTPLYAPPELFEGRPSRSSDQYSLGILYQALLTGLPPFAGRTAAQLAAQHLNSSPDLSPLPPTDRAAIARALSKNPQARFASCRQFVDQLTNRNANDQRRSASPKDRPKAANTAPLPAEVPKIACTPAAPLSPPAGETPCRPTVFIGVGGLGGIILRGIRRRMHERFGSDAQLPAVGFLYLDSDAKQVISARSGGMGGELGAGETLTIGLRPSKAYCSKSDKFLTWMSRRWLFNMPRSQRVEGIRPLGRLAFVDHHATIRQQLRAVLEGVASDEAAKATADVTGLPLTATSPDVILVASLSGGTGSGAAIDLAYLVRDLLADLELPEERVFGMLVHGTAAREGGRDIQRANALSSLKELERLSSIGFRYPGDASCELPNFDHGPFDAAWLVHLGDELADGDWEPQSEKVAEYLYRSSLTPARAFFEESRKPQEDAAEEAGGETRLRTIGIATLSDEAGEMPSGEAEALCRAVLQRWNQTAPAPENEIRQKVRGWIEPLLAELQLTPDHLLNRSATLLSGELGRNVDAFLRARLNRMLAGSESQPSSLPGLLKAIDEDFGSNGNDVPAGHPARILKTVQDDLRAWVRRCSETLGTRIFSAVDHPELRFAGGSATIRAVVDQLDAGAAELQPLLDGIEADRADLLASSAHPSEPASAPGTLCETNRLTLFQYCMQRLCAGVYGALIEAVGEIRSMIAGLEETLAELQSGLGRVSDSFDAAAPAPVDPRSVESLALRLRTVPNLRLSNLVAAAPEQWQAFAQRLHNEVTTFVRRQNPNRSADQTALDAQRDAVELDLRPQLFEAGGTYRILAMLPSAADAAPWARRLEGRYGPCITAQQDSAGEPFFCCEVEGLDYRALIAQIAGGNPAILEMAGRLHTREDVAW